MMQVISEKKNPFTFCYWYSSKISFSMSRINHTFPYSNRRIPAHLVAMTQSLKGYVTRDLWSITSQSKDNLAVNCSGFTITQAFQTSFLFHLKKKLITGL